MARYDERLINILTPDIDDDELDPVIEYLDGDEDEPESSSLARRFLEFVDRIDGVYVYESRNSGQLEFSCGPEQADEILNDFWSQA